MKILILGGSGMLGHKLAQTLSRQHETYVTTRESFAHYARFGIFNKERMVSGVSALDFDSVVRAFEKVQPDIVINCIGVVKQVAAAKDPIPSLTINSLFPHRAAHLSRACSARFIHITTDCVFSGRKGNYTEADVTDAEDLYGRSKLLGEVHDAGCLSLRTSIIGRELETTQGLIEWFLTQQGKSIRGYKKAIFSGFTTLALSGIIDELITKHKNLEGLWQVAAEPISKCDLLTLVNKIYDLKVTIEPESEFLCDRSLNAERFRKATGMLPPSWPEMITQMKQDPTPYAEIRRQHAEK